MGHASRRKCERGVTNLRKRRARRSPDEFRERRLDFPRISSGLPAAAPTAMQRLRRLGGAERNKKPGARPGGSWGGCLGGGALLALVEELQYSGAVRVVAGIVGQGQAVARAR